MSTLLGLLHHALDEPGIDIPIHEVPVVHDPTKERDRRRDALDDELIQDMPSPKNGLGP